ncbi:IS66 family insertion sequence element accessory protein TnpB [Rhizobium laguerreae]|uniref:IS66 family insertion sequence element accessory protein TnpB n=1 Tax=Rhizobium laguerreae TaxID=1076926 RepID=UPI003CCEC5AC
MCCARSRREVQCSCSEEDRASHRTPVFDGHGFCLYYNILQKSRFPWPSAADGTARLTTAQPCRALGRGGGVDWRRPNWGAPPAHVG